MITVKAERNVDPQILTYQADGEIGICMEFQQFNDQQEPVKTVKMQKAAEQAIRLHGMLPAVYR